MRLRGTVAVVVGASSGIGAAAARAFAHEGAEVVLSARREKVLEALAAEIRRDGGRAEVVPVDVTDAASVEAFGRAVRDRHLAVDLLLNGAGVGLGGGLLSTEVADFDEVVATNLRGPFLVLRALLPLMLDGPRPRTVFNIASVAGTIPAPHIVAYSASKWGLRGLSLGVALEVGGRNVRVVSVNPGFVATPMVEGARYPAAKMMQPEEVAETLVRLATLPAGVQVDDLTLHPAHLYTE